VAKTKARSLARDLRLGQPTAQERRKQQRSMWLATAGLVIALGLMAAFLVWKNQPPSAPPPAKPTAADLTAPRSLRLAAAKIGFHPQLIPGVGSIEDKSASDAPAPDSALLKPGTPAPAFSLQTPQGETVSLSDYKGKALMVEFFATSCPHCQAEAPHLKRLYASLDHSSYQMVSINADGESAPSVYAFHRYFGLAYPALLDPGSHVGSWSSPGSPGPVTTAYKINRYPTFYVIAPNGTVHWSGDGEQPTAKLFQELKTAANG
jgi:peroxiredoxin